MKTTGITHRIITSGRRAAMSLLLAMTALTTVWAQNVNPKSIPLTLEAIADGTIITVRSPKEGMQYSINGGAKQPVTTDPISVSKDKIVQFYGDGTSIESYSGANIQCSADCYIYGNIMSLVDETGFEENTTLPADKTFFGLFSYNTHLKNHPTHQFVLPATKLSSLCYASMFERCTNLTVAPELPATTLANSCYAQMFSGCTGLTTAPELPAKDLADNCYDYMFASCSGLTTAPKLPATTLVTSCYAYMFKSCTSLTMAPELPATTLKSNCYTRMFEGCTNLSHVRCMATDISAANCTFEWLKNVASQGIFVKATKMNWSTGVSGIPEGWTVNSYTPAPALTLEAIADGTTITVSNPQNGMQYSKNGGAKQLVTTNPISVSKDDIIQFYGDGTNITKYYGTNIQCSADCYIYGNVMSLVDENEFEYNTTLPADYTFAELFSANIYLKNHLEKPLVLPATSLTISCYMSMFEGCSGLTTAPELPAKRLATGCYSNMFNGCNNLRSAPELLATTLTKNCYKEMFKKCNNLNYVKCLATDISAGGCTTDWLSGAAESGTFVKSAKTEWSTSASGIPVNWTVKSYTSAPALTLEAIAGGIITVYNPKEGMQYSIDGGTKTEMTATTEIPVTAGQKVQFYGNGTSITQYGIFNKETRIQCSADCYIYGNIMSLVDENDFEYNTTLTGDDVFQKLFYNSGSNYTQLKNHPDKPLVLPATTLAKGCYAYMFYGCKGLTTAPELPATTMTYACYTYMFQGCIGLIKAPKLPAKELATYCYLHMFNGCTGLTAAPELPATELADNCYYSMFYECTGLTTAPKLSATTLTNHCYASMFYGCRSLTTAPELPATTLAPGCYRSMFERCTSLNYVKCLATDISAEECTLYWLKTVAAQGTFMKADNTNWNTGGDGIPEGWMVVGPNGIALYDTADNTATLMDNDEKTVDYVVLAGRTLYKDGKWNTLCLPFDVSDGDNYDGITFTGTPLEGTTAVELNSSSFDSGTLTLNFSGVDAITAGKPYLVKWAPTGTNLQNPIFYNVAIHKDAGAIGTEVIHFYGTFVSTTYAAEDRSILFLGADNTLYYPEAGATIGACRAYFELADGLTCGDPNNPNSIRTFNLNFGDGSEQTGITTTNITNFTNSDAWYSVDGVRLSGQPTTPGLYIHGGKKVAIK